MVRGRKINKVQWSTSYSTCTTTQKHKNYSTQSHTHTLTCTHSPTHTHTVNSDRCPTHERGTMMRKGPLFPFFSMRQATRAMVWMVLPSPISSARIPFKLLLYSETSHSRPVTCGVCEVRVKTCCEGHAIILALIQYRRNCDYSIIKRMLRFFPLCKDDIQ